MFSRRGDRPKYPNVYCKIHNPSVSEPFVSNYLGQQSIIVDAETGARRSSLIITNNNSSEVKTMMDLFQRGLDISRLQPCLGSRYTISEEYSWITYQEVDEKVQAFGSALVEVMSDYSESEKFVGIFGRNSVQWFVTQYACFCYSFTVVPLYATLGDEAMEYILTQNQQFEDLKVQYGSSVKFYSFDEFLDMGKRVLKSKIPPSPQDLCLICYTSGSSGLPKGVMITHENLVDTVCSTIESTEEKIYCKNSLHFSYLPFAHIMEQVSSSAAVFSGAQIGFLTGPITGLLDDAEALKPTVIPVVPRVLSRIYEKYNLALGNSFIKRQLFNYTFKRNLKILNSGKVNDEDILDSLFFKKLRQALGGRVCMIITGGASISPELFTFFRVAFNGLIVSGYGSTEISGVASLTVLGECHTGIVGAITTRLEVKLADVPDLGLVAMRDNRGEICVKGKRCTKGYYKDPQSTAKLRDSDGWLHTGDIGEWTSEGALKIVDRVKSMFKLAQGEYVAPEKVEMVYQECQVIDQILVDGKPEQNFPVAVVVPNFPVLRSYIQHSSMSDSDANDGEFPILETVDANQLSDADLCKNKRIIRLVLQKMNKIATEKQLKGFEKVKSIYLTDQIFTIENGLLTPTMKLSRQKARQHFKSVIEMLYAETDTSDTS